LNLRVAPRGRWRAKVALGRRVMHQAHQSSRLREPVVICPRCGRRMATKEHKPMGPKQRKAIRFTDSLVEVAYVCESCGTEIKRTIREM
jgi:DNA-directed RNA polymerase subunit RPC12/RpoP